MIARLSALYALTTGLVMGLPGGGLKRMELLSARLGDAVSALHPTASCAWRYDGDGRASTLPFARPPAIRDPLGVA